VLVQDFQGNRYLGHVTCVNAVGRSASMVVKFDLLSSLLNSGQPTKFDGGGAVFWFVDRGLLGFPVSDLNANRRLTAAEIEGPYAFCPSAVSPLPNRPIGLGDITVLDLHS
jgi:hypothetical protein